MNKKTDQLRARKLILVTMIFFLLVNTIYFWEGKLGILAFPAYLILLIVYLGLIITFIKYFYLAFKEKFMVWRRLLITGILALVVFSTFYKPFGIIDFDKLSGADLLIASREGGGNCITTVKLKEDSVFISRDVCFGVTETKGFYKLKRDTVFFESENYWKFGVLKSSNYDKGLTSFFMFKDGGDTTGVELTLIKNELHKLK